MKFSTSCSTTVC